MDCMICLGKKNVSSKMNSCGCKLNIHKKCYNEWNNNYKGQCPLCRRNSTSLKIRVPTQPKPKPALAKKLLMVAMVCVCVIIAVILIV